MFINNIQSQKCVIYGEEVTYILSIKLISFIKKFETLNYYYYYFLEFVKIPKDLYFDSLDSFAKFSSCAKNY